MLNNDAKPEMEGVWPFIDRYLDFTGQIFGYQGHHAFANYL